MKEFKNIEHKDETYTVQLIKALDGKGIPFSAFVIFEKSDFDNTNINNVFNLSQVQDNVIYIKKGHEISAKDESDVMQLIQNYNFDLIKGQDSSSSSDEIC